MAFARRCPEFDRRAAPTETARRAVICSADRRQGPSRRTDPVGCAVFPNSLSQTTSRLIRLSQNYGEPVHFGRIIPRGLLVGEDPQVPPRSDTVSLPEAFAFGATRKGFALGQVGKDFAREPFAPGLFQKVAVKQQYAINRAAARAIFANNWPAYRLSSAVKGFPRIEIDFLELLLCHKIVS